MARSGVYKSDVKKARDALLALGKHPSLDAVRIELGNTGSKSTIHKYLKELETEDGGVDAKKASISEALQDLVERLSAQLHDESSARIDEVETEAAEKARQHEEALKSSQHASDNLKSQLATQETRLQQELAAHGQTRESLQRESIARHTAEQQVSDLKERLLENENHRRSLEEKHQHAREALEHYRTSVKEQREQDARRHEQQVQQLQAEIRTLNQNAIVKQEEVTRLNQEGARLVADLSHAHKAQREQDDRIRQLEKRIETLQPFEERCRLLEVQTAQQDTLVCNLRSQLADAGKDMHRLHIDSAAAAAKLETQQAVTAELRSYLDKLKPVEIVPEANVRA